MLIKERCSGICCEQKYRHLTLTYIVTYFMIKSDKALYKNTLGFTFKQYLLAIMWITTIGLIKKEQYTYYVKKLMVVI